MTSLRNICKKFIDRKFLIPAFVFCALAAAALLAYPKTKQPDASTAIALMGRGDSCRLEWKYKHALGFYQQAFDDPAVARNVDLQLQLLERIMRTHDVLRHWKEMPESSYRLYMLARERGDSLHTAMALLMRGKRLFILGQKEEGMRVAMDAAEMLKRTDAPHKDHELSHFYAIIARLRCLNGDYEEAMRMSQLQEHYAQLSEKSHSEEWYRRNMQRVHIVRLGILARMGRLAEADSIYRKYDIQPIMDPLCGDALLTYYRLRGMNAELLNFLNLSKKNICEDGDSMGRNMQRLQKDFGDFYLSIGDYPKAVEYYASTSSIADTLAARTLNNLNADVRKVMENERRVASHSRQLIIAGSVMALFVLISLLGLRQALIIRKRNHRMMALIDRLMHYRNIVIQNGDTAEKVEATPVEAVDDEELRHFREVDKRIMQERLFSNPDFGRDDLMRLLGVDKNALPALLQRIARTNVSGYIIIKRMEYAVSLMREHPEYTIESIADACGIKSPATFVRNFKTVYDMTPSDFRRHLAEDSDE